MRDYDEMERNLWMKYTSKKRFDSWVPFMGFLLLFLVTVSVLIYTVISNTYFIGLIWLMLAFVLIIVWSIYSILKYGA
jgi:hypothetical protein